jgi:phosphohistidine phosphatase
MRLYLLRHGQAEAFSEGGDPARRLSAEGIAILQNVLELASVAGVRPSLILSSPFARAIETAQLAARLLSYPGEILRTSSLTSDSAPLRAWNEIRAHGGETSILAATHEPLMSATVAWIVGSTRAMIRVPPAAMVCIDIPVLRSQPVGVIEWMISPDLVLR